MAADKKEEKQKHTKYEKARIIGTRALQISSGAPFMVKLSEEELKSLKYSPKKIAFMEYEKGLILIKVKK